MQLHAYGCHFRTIFVSSGEKFHNNNIYPGSFSCDNLVAGSPLIPQVDRLTVFRLLLNKSAIVTIHINTSDDRPLRQVCGCF